MTAYEAQKNSQFIALLITSVEHDWAFAMELKQSDDPRKRHHMRNKLRKGKGLTPLLIEVTKLNKNPKIKLQNEHPSYPL